VFGFFGFGFFGFGFGFLGFGLRVSGNLPSHTSIVGRVCNMRASNAGGLTRWEKGSALRMEQIERCSIAAASHSMRQRIVILRRRIGVLDHFQYIAYLSHSIYFLSIINNIF